MGTSSELDTIPVFKMSGASGNNVKFVMAQVSSWIEPYATINSTTNNRVEIVMRKVIQLLFSKMTIIMESRHPIQLII
ncbi:MAG TPA: hypothetical protein PKA90_00450 [Ignavibacteria bacterium]|nr:hypothetical protein [Ignavibacteria bacterium]HMR38874.1 hypothetical protein [Ignavibacteria bacterium]